MSKSTLPLNHFAGVACFLILVPLAAAQATTLNVGRLPNYPFAISNNAVTSVDNGDGTYTLYSFMGMRNPTISASVTPISFKLDGPNGGWTRIANAPSLEGKAKVGASAISVAGDVYLIGGYTLGVNERTEKRLFRYAEDTNEYIELAPVPVEVDDTVVGTYQDRYIYLASGWHGPINDNVLNVQVYDTVTDTWQQATAMPGPETGLFGHAGTVVGDRIVALDGARGSGGFPISDRVFVGQIDPDGTGDLTNVTWTEVDSHPGLPTYRAAATQSAVLGGQLLMLGGTDNPYNVSGTGYNGDPSFPLDQALLYDPISDTWTDVALSGDVLPTMDHRGLVQIGNGWATIGGMTAPGVASDQVVFYQVPEGAGLLPMALLALACWPRRQEVLA